LADVASLTNSSFQRVLHPTAYIATITLMKMDHAHSLYVTVFTL
jgi:hypothetical protein